MARTSRFTPVTREEQKQKMRLGFMENDLESIYDKIQEKKKDISHLEVAKDFSEEPEYYDEKIEEKQKELERLENKRDDKYEKIQKKKRDLVQACRAKEETSNCIDKFLD